MKGMKAWGIREEDEMYGKLTDQNVVNFKRTMQKKKKGTRACLEDETLWQEVGNRNEKKGKELLEEQRGYGRDEICLVKWNLGWYDGVPLSPHRRAHTAAKNGPMRSSVKNVILCGVAIASGWCEAGGDGRKAPLCSSMKDRPQLLWITWMYSSS